MALLSSAARATTVSGVGPEPLAELQAAVGPLHRWYRRSARDLPWRRSRDPYAVWVSETMLQQTRVDTAVPYYERWMAALPTVDALARAGDEQVLRLWEGLGYYARARNLSRAAREVRERFGGRIPADPDQLRTLPGVGAYTAAAVASIAFGRDVAAVDGNVRRVLARLAAVAGPARRPPASRTLEALAAALLPPGTARVHNQAVMELGALVCTPRDPACAACPVAGPCRARAAGRPEAYPERTQKKTVPHHRVAVGIVCRDDGRVFIDRRPYGGLLGGLWEFPGGKIEPGETPEDALHRELDEEFGLRVAVEGALGPVPHAYTHFRVTLHPFLCRFASMVPRAGEGRPWQWVPGDALDRYPMPRANRKILAQLRTSNLEPERKRSPCPPGSPT